MIGEHVDSPLAISQETRNHRPKNSVGVSLPILKRKSSKCLTCKDLHPNSVGDAKERGSCGNAGWKSQEICSRLITQKDSKGSEAHRLAFSSQTNPVGETMDRRWPVVFFLYSRKSERWYTVYEEGM